MRTARRALAWLLGCCAVALADSSRETPAWTTKASDDFRKAFEAQTGGHFERARWYRQWYRPGGDKQVIAIGWGTALASSKPAGPRLRTGTAYDFFKEAVAGDEGWVPGEPFEWKRKGDVRPYALVAPPAGDPALARHPRWAERIFDQPIFVDPGLGGPEVVALADFVWHELTAADPKAHPGLHPRAFQPGPRGKLPWENLSEMRPASSLPEAAAGARSGNPALVFSLGEEGRMTVVVEKSDAGYRAIGEFEVKY